MEAKTVKEVLIAARWILEHHHWMQRHTSSKDNDGGYHFCALGAISYVQKDNPGLYYLASNALRDALPGRDVVIWNDQEGRTKKEVLALYDRAIEAAQ